MSLPDLDKICPTVKPGVSQKEIKGVQRIVKVRRDIMERLCACNELQAQMKIHQSTIDHCQHDLNKADLPNWGRLSIEGRAEEAEARKEYAYQQVVQACIEVQLLMAALIPEGETT
jgi:hypothetical protein